MCMVLGDVIVVIRLWNYVSWVMVSWLCECDHASVVMRVRSCDVGLWDCGYVICVMLL